MKHDILKSEMITCNISIFRRMFHQKSFSDVCDRLISPSRNSKVLGESQKGLVKIKERSLFQFWTM